MPAFIWGTVCVASMKIVASRDQYLKMGHFDTPRLLNWPKSPHRLGLTRCTCSKCKKYIFCMLLTGWTVTVEWVSRFVSCLYRRIACIMWLSCWTKPTVRCYIIKCLPSSFCYWPVCRAELTWTEQRAKWPKRNITLTELKNCLVCLEPLTVFFSFFLPRHSFSNDISFPSWIRTLPEAIFYIMAKFETWKKYPSANGKYFWHLICKYVLF